MIEGVIAMPYVTDRLVHDADAHIMETPTWLADHADPAIRDRIKPLELTSGNELRQTGDPEDQLRDLEASFARIRAKHASDEYRALEAEEIMMRKNFAATGSFIADDRSRALDLLGFASQLVFNTFHNGRLHEWEHRGDVEFAYGVARAHNRGMIEFCGRSAAAPYVLRAARRFRTGRGNGRRSAGHGRGRAVGRVGLPTGALAQPHRARSGVGTRAGGRCPDRVPRRRHR